jgi:hypothetical protein
MYLIEVKKKSPAGLNMFQESFGSDLAIRQFFRVFLGKSEQLTRTTSAPAAPSVLRPARFATMPDDVPPQILCRGPLGHERQTRNAGLSNAPYPLRRGDSGHHPYASGSVSSHGHRGIHFSHQSAHPYSLHQQQNYPHPNVPYSNPSAYQPHPSQSGNSQQQTYRQSTFDNAGRNSLPSFLEVFSTSFYIIKKCKLICFNVHFVLRITVWMFKMSFILFVSCSQSATQSKDWDQWILKNYTANHFSNRRVH